MTKNAVSKAIERGRQATKKAFAKITTKPTSTELLRSINTKMDKAVEVSKRIHEMGAS